MDKNKYEIGDNSKTSEVRGPGPNRNVETAKDFKVAIKKLRDYSKKYNKILLIAIIFAMLGSILTLMGPSNLTKITDEITEGVQRSFMSSEDGIDMEKIYSIGTLLIVIYSIGYVLSVTQGVIMSKTMQKIAKSLRFDLQSKMNRLPMSYYFKNSKGDILSRVTNDIDTIGQALSQSVGIGISAVTLLLGATVMMFYTNIQLAITAILSTAIGFVLMATIMKKSQKYFKMQQKHLGSINGHIEEMYAGHAVLKAYNGEESAITKFDETNNILRKSVFKAQALSGLMMPIMTFIGNFGYVCVCIIGAILAMNGTITFGIIVAFMVYIRLFTQPLGQMAQAIQNLQSAAAASERVFEFLEEEEMEDETNKMKTLVAKGEVEFKNVHFGYDKNKIIINDFSAKVKPGQKIAIVGPTGAGKTTMINLLMRFYEINSGDILIDGVSIKDLKRQNVQTNFSMVLQDTWIFEGTFIENIVYSTKNVTQEKLEEATKAVGLHHFVKTLPQGYNTVLNDKVSLSQGQKQQITIARAMLDNKPMLILDEATSSIDTRTELQIQNAMDILMENRTSFVIAHRLSTIKNADLILVMKDGEIIEKGSHDQLLEQKGFYSELYNSQFEE